jgi:hypothetical protein
MKELFERAINGFSKKDTRDFHSYLTRMVSQALTFMADSNTIDGMHPKEFKDNHHWNRTLRKIARDIYIDEPYPSKARLAKRARAFRLLTVNLKHLWW